MNDDAIRAPQPNWCLYLIECRNGAWYAGITNDIERRYAMHLAGRGAKYTRANPPLRLLGTRAFADRSSASKAEHAIRRLPRAQKLAFLQP
ncbi:MAG TPA: GIY-YIG nuclease family protein [Pseudomonadota bacterium]|nr:GIY-YIG nuclease family protein [Rhodanobacteraceae bacterium]MBP9154694.1 GIY-YIG nuclease family protein [Xanthomonadales bacterium]HQW81642.1 GIY-YIG nuclease family protein [Pseudomonadota bacterium]